jgi:diaminopimelate epimerase
MPLTVLKGHGTENDFVLVPDLDGALDLTPELVRALCDRHAGIGGDGVLRVVRQDGQFFMDYRNADGSIAEMCGNGVRVFVRYLQHAGLVQDQTAVVTRGGLKQVRTTGDELTVRMGSPVFRPDLAKVTPAGHAPLQAFAHVEMPNPHLVSWVDSLDELHDLDLFHAPTVEPGRPDGQNLEFVHRTGPRHLTMRVHERGVGETRSCGTGICAIVAGAAAQEDGPDGTPWRVDVPGGTLTVVWQPDQQLELTGPAVLVGEISLPDEWLSHYR